MKDFVRRSEPRAIKRREQNLHPHTQNAIAFIPTMSIVSTTEPQNPDIVPCAYLNARYHGILSVGGAEFCGELNFVRSAHSFTSKKFA